jgi:outer membrane receptor for ferrienterochelin and colicin
VIGNADLLPEEAWYKSISAEYIADNLNLSVTAHDNAIKNRINTSQVWNEALSRTEMRYENIAEAQITGVDVSLQWNFLKNFQLKGGYSFANAVDKATNRQLSGNCKHSGTVSLTYQQTHLPFLSATETPYSLLLSARVMSPRIIGDIINDGNGKITETFTDSYFISRFVYTQQFPVYKQVQGDLQVGINNLLNYTNHDYLSNSAGRTCFVSLGIRF